MRVSVLLNGRPASGLPVADRGLAYGDGLFETIKVISGVALFLPEHLERLSRDCARLRVALDLNVLRAEIAQLLHEAGDPDRAEGVLKIIVTRGVGARGYQPLDNAAGQRLLQFFPQKFPPPIRAAAQVRLCRQRLAEQPALAGMKHLNRLEQVLARAEWSDPQIAEGLMLDGQGRLIEGTASNLFLVKEQKIHTPRLSRCGVAGVMRRIVMERLAPGAVIEADLCLEDLYGAQEVFFTNSVIGIREVARIDCLRLPRGNVTIALQHSLQRLIENEVQ